MVLGKHRRVIGLLGVIAVGFGVMAVLPGSAGATLGTTPAVGPQTDGQVFALRMAIPGNVPVVAVGGKFAHMGSRPAAGLAVLRASDRAVLWSTTSLTDANGNPAQVDALEVSGSTLFVGGTFRRINGQPRNFVAAFNVATGTLYGWNPGAPFRVRAISAGTTIVLVGGEFTKLKAIRRSDGTTAWEQPTDCSVRAIKANVDKTRFWVGGVFDHYGVGLPFHHGIVLVRDTDGTVDPQFTLGARLVKNGDPNDPAQLNPCDGSKASYSGENVIALSAVDRLLVGIGGAYNRFYVVDRPTGARVSWVKQFDGDVQGVSPCDNGGYCVVGHMGKRSATFGDPCPFCGPSITGPRFIREFTATGVQTSFNPHLEGFWPDDTLNNDGGWALFYQPKSSINPFPRLFIGGSFTTPRMGFMLVSSA
jgi:hypothetical protein